jgi:predicted P-loop ATPase
MEYETVFPRRCVMVGTTNDDEFLADPSGERRWLPAKVLGTVDVEGLIADRDQLWAEARERWRADGVLWRTAEGLARGEHGAFKERDSWEDAISAWLEVEELDGSKPLDRGFLRVADVLSRALRYDPKAVGKREEMRVTRVLTAMGFERGVFWHEGKTIKGWSLVKNCD